MTRATIRRLSQLDQLIGYLERPGVSEIILGVGRPIGMRNAAGLTNLTARPVSLDQLTAMLRGSPVASLVPEDDSTTPPLDVQIGTRRVRVQIGRRGDEVLVRLSRPEGPPKTQSIAKVAQPPARVVESSVRIKTPTKRPKAPTARPKPATTRPKTATARAKSGTAPRAKTTTLRPKTATARPKTRTKKPSASRTSGIEILTPSPASVVGTSRVPTTRDLAPGASQAIPTRELSPSGIFDALTLDDDAGIELGTPVPSKPVSSPQIVIPTTPPRRVDVDAPTHSSSPAIVIPAISERIDVEAPTHISSPGIKLPSVSGVESTAPIAVIAQGAARTASGELAALVEAARARGASDLHVAAARVTSIRTDGQLVPLDASPALTAAEAEGLLLPLLDREMRTALNRVGYVDFALEAPSGGRLRSNICKQQQGLKGTFRLALPGPLPLDKLGLPPELAKIVSHHQGLVVIAGPSGHGKTTTLSSLVDLVNSTKPHHVLTIEDPVEIVHERKMAVISQREVGRHTTSFARGLKASLREDPDVIVIGELRDRESVEIALTAAETGHLVLATMSTPSAAKTIDRLIDMFPPEEHNQVRASVAGALRAIVAQRLLPKRGGGVVPAVELVTGVLPLAVLIREDKLYQLPNLMQRGRALGMIRLEESIADLTRKGLIVDDAKTQLIWKVK